MRCSSGCFRASGGRGSSMGSRGAWVSILCLVVASGCSESHGTPDDTGTDADGSLDARAPSDTGAEPCVDRDGDGFGAASCGGGDCDDSDPGITPSFSECVARDRVLRCLGGVMEEVSCPPGAASCDARTGACAATACGDGVLHEGEACDDGNASDDDVCSATCEDLPCAASRDCPEDRPSCSDRRSDRRDDLLTSEVVDGAAGNSVQAA